MRLLRPDPRSARAALLAVLAVVSLLCAAAARGARRAGRGRPRRATAATELGPLGAPVSAAPARRAPRARPACARGRRADASPGRSPRCCSAGQISEATYRKDYAIYTAAKRSLGRLSGTRRAELGAVLANTQAIAAAGQLTASRQAVVFLTLEKNRYWWTTKPLLSGTVRVSFPPSKIVWQRYPGQGIQIQWLGTFGAGNGFYLSGHENSNLRQLVEEVIPLATKRAGGLAWEYMFRFDGGAPPWTSGLSQGTGLQVLARAGQRFKEPAYTAAAKASARASSSSRRRTACACRPRPAPGTRSTPTRRPTASSTASSSPSSASTTTPRSPRTRSALKLFEAGDAEARAGQVPRYDTGAWSLYDQYGESDLSYHELLTEFLQHLCERTRKGPPNTRRAAAGAARAAADDHHAAHDDHARDARRRHLAASALRAAAAATQIAGDEIYCTTAKRFTAYETTPPAVALLDAQPARRHARGRAGLAVEDLDGHDQGPQGLEARLEQQRDRARGQAAAAVGDAERAAAPSPSASPRATWPATSRRRAGRSRSAGISRSPVPFTGTHA